MADTYSQIFIHVIFAVKGRKNLISNNWKNELYKYISGIVKNEDQKIIAINGMPDHLHILVGIKPAKTLSDLVRDIKSNSSRFINEKGWINSKFEWQQGFGAFSLSHSQLPTIIRYIEDQEVHHQKKSFREEYEEFLKAFQIEYKTQYLFEDLN